MLLNKSYIKQITRGIDLEMCYSSIKEMDEVLTELYIPDNTFINILIEFINGSDLSLYDTEVNQLIPDLDSELNNSNDFYIEIDNQEYRFINDDVIEDTFEEYCIDLFDECYLHDVPESIRSYIDYDKFVQDCKYDGYAHSFSCYDGNTHIGVEGWNIFRHN